MFLRKRDRKNNNNYSEKGATIFAFVIRFLKDILELALKMISFFNLISRTVTKFKIRFTQNIFYSKHLLFCMKEKGLTPEIRNLEQSNVFLPQLFTEEYFLIYQRCKFWIFLILSMRKNLISNNKEDSDPSLSPPLPISRFV